MRGVVAGLLGGLALLVASSASAALPGSLAPLPDPSVAEVSVSEAAYCQGVAEADYQAAVDAGSGLPDDAYEGIGAECEVQWLIVDAEQGVRGRVVANYTEK